MNLTVLHGTLAVCRLPASDRIPSWALELHEGFVSITRTPDELSIVCPQEAVPPDTTVEEGFRALMVPGPIPFEQTGVLARIATPLAAAGIPIFAIATYDTDYVLVREADLDRALVSLVGSRRLVAVRLAVRAGDRLLARGDTPPPTACSSPGPVR